MKQFTAPEMQNSNQPFGIRSAEFNARIEAGLRRAPEERAKAIKEFWNWIVSRG